MLLNHLIPYLTYTPTGNGIEVCPITAHPHSLHKPQKKKAPATVPKKTEEKKL